ncbi:MAG: LLM class flavin-dependent oxidoreductase [Actinobacteria bacterium]|nr:LLM class flavin-dependent oxidoreductase [Actinomycetota bacterium]
MRFGLFYEHQLPRPWEEGAEGTLLRDALEQVELADRLGIDVVWEVEHHFLEEYSHSSAPEVFLAAVSQRTSRIRLGHGIVQLPPAYNHPARVAERVATLDLVSGGRVELGTGESSSQVELGGFGVDRDRKREQWEESLEALVRMMVEEPFAGIDGRFVRMPPRNVVPKPLQRLHPPLWVACSRRETILLAARKGLGALSFSFVEPERAEEWVKAYYRIIASGECVPAGFSVNPNVAVVVPFMCHEDESTAIERGIDGAHFFGYSLAHYYVFGRHRPGTTDVWEEFLEHRGDMGFARELIRPDGAPLGVTLLQEGLGSLRGAVGTPDQVSDLIERYERAGVDQVILVAQAGKNRHEHVCESLELFGREVLPRFAERAAEVERGKRERLAEAVSRAMARREPPRRLAREYEVSVQGEPGPAPDPYAPRRAGRDRRPVGERVRTAAAGARDRVERRVASLVRGRPDRQVERLIGSSLGLRAVFGGMARQFRADRAQGFRGTVQYEVEGPGGVRPWAIRISDGRARAVPVRDPDPAVTLRLSALTLGRLVSEELEPGRAFLEGHVRVEGDLQVATRLSEWFGRGSFS